jgi:hypothetical protein
MGREPELTDAQVIARSVHEPGAFRAIFDRHFADVHRYPRHRAGLDLADDLAAETFVRAFAVRGRFRPREGDAARAWLFDPARAALIAVGASDEPRSAEIRWSTLYAVRSAVVARVGERPRR